jgi:hypothetical protein
MKMNPRNKQIAEILGIPEWRLESFQDRINSFPPEPPENLPVEEIDPEKRCNLCGDLLIETGGNNHHCS